MKVTAVSSSMNRMWKVLRRRWKYLTAKLSGRWEETADPKVQLEQAIGEAQDQHRRLVEQASQVVANQKQTELQLNRAMKDLEKDNNSTRQALAMANDAAQRGDTAKATEYNQTAEAFANRLIATEKRVDDLKTMHLQAAQAAQQAKAAVQQNANALQRKLAERQKLLSQLDQARMQEQLNVAMASLGQTVDQDVPSLDDVRTKIEAQYARALGTAELAGQGVEARMLEIEQAGVYSEARQRLDEMRGEMGLLVSGEPAGGQLPAPAPQALGAGVPQDQGAGGPAQEGVAGVTGGTGGTGVTGPAGPAGGPSQGQTPAGGNAPYSGDPPGSAEDGASGASSASGASQPAGAQPAPPAG